MRNLVMNCQRRAMYEDSLRKEHGLSKSKPVDIPMPGIAQRFAIHKDFFYQPLLERAEADHLMTTDQEEAQAS